MKEIKEKIINFLNERSEVSKTNGYVIGISGGIDSAVVSTLCAMTGKPTYCIAMPIHQKQDENDRGDKHIDFLIENFPNVTAFKYDLTNVYDAFKSEVSETSELGLINTRSRLRMACLYATANTHNLLVVGTGNKVEDFGIGFFTKYGDGGVDISPIGDLYKSEVYKLGEELGVITEILNAKPTDGLWDDGRTDEDQIGATYADLEWCMEYQKVYGMESSNVPNYMLKAWDIYVKRHTSNRHKMDMPPICKVK